MGWAGFAAAFVAFFVVHSVPLRPPVRGRLTHILGQRGFTLIYSILSLAVLIWLIIAAGRAPWIPFWYPASWQPWVPMAGMALACVILAVALGRPNPFSFGGPSAGFDPQHPGVVRWMRHPVLWALALWAGSHLVANGDLAHIVLFGTFAVFAILGQRIIDRRGKRAMGNEWDVLHRRAKAASLFAPISWPGAILRILMGLIVWAALVLLHPVVIGVSPLPW
ncbi:NnrU family protein [Oceaniovalibus guishaninsula JLT2003]|uniref:NnrU family protein n=1 Tax=Oceaniovalibus guishaninsula JLT2003 TaxID=1231392 RepID=K2I7S3_9RHOB|nr:NnrU family protein [Oceaniovalibus guishaninsula]EKE45065.1 NnrU family protein [Oceaniovalibus guishaninsula JLT2003]